MPAKAEDDPRKASDQDAYRAMGIHDIDNTSQSVKEFAVSRQNALGLQRNYLKWGVGGSRAMSQNTAAIGGSPEARKERARVRWAKVRQYFVRRAQHHDILTFVIEVFATRLGVTISSSAIERFRVSARAEAKKDSKRRNADEHISLPAPTYNNARQRKTAMSSMQWLPPYHASPAHFQSELPYLTGVLVHTDVLSTPLLSKPSPMSGKRLREAIRESMHDVKHAKCGRMRGSTSEVTEEKFPVIMCRGNVNRRPSRASVLEASTARGLEVISERSMDFSMSDASVFLTQLGRTRPKTSKEDRKLRTLLREFEAMHPNGAFLEGELLVPTDITTIRASLHKDDKSKVKNWRKKEISLEARVDDSLHEYLEEREKERYLSNTSKEIFTQVSALITGDACTQSRIRLPPNRARTSVWKQGRLACQNDSGVIARAAFYDRLRHFVDAEGGALTVQHEDLLYAIKLYMEGDALLGEPFFWAMMTAAGADGVKDFGIVRTLHYIRFVVQPCIPLEEMIRFCDEHGWATVAKVPSSLEGLPWKDPHELRAEHKASLRRERMKTLERAQKVREEVAVAHTRAISCPPVLRPVRRRRMSLQAVEREASLNYG